MCVSGMVEVGATASMVDQCGGVPCAAGDVCGGWVHVDAARSLWARASPRCAGPGCRASRRATGVPVSRP